MHTSLMGYIRATFEELTDKLGQPEMSQDDESQAEWERELNGKPFTVYDKLEDVPAQEVTLWHVGGPDWHYGKVDPFKQELEKLLGHKIYENIWDVPTTEILGDKS